MDDNIYLVKFNNNIYIAYDYKRNEDYIWKLENVHNLKLKDFSSISFIVNNEELSKGHISEMESKGVNLIKGEDSDPKTKATILKIISETDSRAISFEDNIEMLLYEENCVISGDIGQITFYDHNLILHRNEDDFVYDLIYEKIVDKSEYIQISLSFNEDDYIYMYYRVNGYLYEIHIFKLYDEFYSIVRSDREWKEIELIPEKILISYFLYNEFNTRKIATNEELYEIIENYKIPPK